jgi:hypothetical protein
MDRMPTVQKITVEVPVDLLEQAQRATGEGVTSTVRRGLELVARTTAYDQLRAMKGKMKLSRAWTDLKHDRR